VTIRFAIAAAAVILLATGPAAARADAQTGRFALVVQGASGDPEYASLHRQWLDRLTAVLRDRFGFDDAHLTVLAETPAAREQAASAANLKAALARLAADAKPGDLVFVLLIGHGSGEGADAKFNLVGPDLTVAEWSALLKPVPGHLAVVNTTSVSFPFVKGLSAPDRVIIAATNSSGQRYATMFAAGFIEALTAEVADADKNGRISLLEAFTYASRQTQQHYAQQGKLATERAVLDDNGDGAARDATTAGPDGAVAGVTYLDAVAAPTSADPETQQLLLRQQALIQQVDDLRRRRPGMPAAEFDREFEKLIVELALVSREVRRKGIK
jgi:hypothetical protein